MNYSRMTQCTGPVVAGLCLYVILISGCRRHSQTTTAPATPQNAAPATAPAIRPVAALWIDGASYRFPPATLVLSAQGEGMSGTLCSDDPPAAIHSGYHGNSFMIQMKLDITSVDDLDNYVWKYAADPSAEVDSNTGIFLDGTARQLQPSAVSIAFHKKGDDLVADIEGNVQSLDTQNPAAKRQPAAVSGRLYVETKTQ